MGKVLSFRVMTTTTDFVYLPLASLLSSKVLSSRRDQSGQGFNNSVSSLRLRGLAFWVEEAGAATLSV